jgi:hypothetical protein
MNYNELKQIIEETIRSQSILLSRPEPLNEASYGRVKRKIEQSMIPFVMISAFRGNLEKKENLKRQKKLEKIVSTMGFPFTKMPGSGYVEEPEEEGESPREVKENSIIIWNERRPDVEESDLSIFELAKFLANEYNQDSFIFGKPFKSDDEEKKMIVRLYNKNGDTINEPWAGPWSSLTQIDDDDLFWSAIGSKKTKLTELKEQYEKMQVKSKLDAMKKQYGLDAIKSALKRFK